MANVDLTKAKRVLATVSESEVNKLIDNGWSLIDIAPGKDEMGYPLMRYSLAWIAEGEPKEVRDIF
jgi:hypothetical protein